VNHEAPDELFRPQSHGPGLVAILAAMVFPRERDAFAGDAEDAVIGFLWVSLRSRSLRII
jgi:hypothetical protein